MGRTGGGEGEQLARNKAEPEPGAGEEGGTVPAPVPWELPEKGAWVARGAPCAGGALTQPLLRKNQKNRQSLIPERAGRRLTVGRPRQPGQPSHPEPRDRHWSSAGTWQTAAHLADSPEESLLRQPGWAIHSLAVVLWAPAGTVDVDVVGIEAQRMGLHCISHLPIQHAHA